MPVIEEERGYLRQVNTDYQTLTMATGGVGKESVHKYRLPLSQDEFRAMIGKRVRCVLEDKVVVSMVTE